MGKHYFLGMVDENNYCNNQKYWEVQSFWKNDVQPWQVPSLSNEMHVPYL